MGEQWIPANKAVEIAGSEIALCTRAHAGLVTARADRFQVNGEVKALDRIPVEFWWARGHAALDQDWQTGDFSTWIEQRHHLQAFGVRFALSELLEFVPFEKRAELVLSLSVAGSEEWISADSTLKYIYGQTHLRKASQVVVEQAALGFLSARAVEAMGTKSAGSSTTVVLEEREWNVPNWFWTNFTVGESSNQNWEVGRFSGYGKSPHGLCQIELRGLHFLRSSVEARFAVQTHSEPVVDESGRGRKASYDWDLGCNVVWGRIFRGEFMPTNQAEVEKALRLAVSIGGREPSESTARPYASRIWSEYKKA